jgi:hypothetical protein
MGMRSFTSCQIMPFMSNNAIHVKSCQILSFMYWFVIHIKSWQIFMYFGLCLRAQALVTSSAHAGLKKNVLCVMSTQTVVIFSEHALACYVCTGSSYLFCTWRIKKNLFLNVFWVMSAQAVVISSAHAGLKKKYIVCFVCTASSYFFCKIRFLSARKADLNKNWIVRWLAATRQGEEEKFIDNIALTWMA